MSYNLGTAEGRIVIDGSGAQRGFGVATVAANAFFGAIQNKLDSVERLGENLIKVGAAGGIGLGAAVKAASNFEAGLSAIEAVSGATEKQMEGIRTTALRLGKDTVFSATEAAFAMESLIKAGVSTEDVMAGAADATVALAAAGGVDLVTAAEIAANALNQFNLQGRDMGKVADLIAGAANASAIDVQDFGFSLSQAGAVANLTGLKFDDLAVAIAEMGQAGIKGSDAGTSIKTFLTNLIPTTDKQTELFKKLGLITLDTGKAMQTLASKGVKPASKSVSDINRALQEYVAKTGGAAVGTATNAKQAAKLGAELGLMKNAFFDANGEAKNFAEIQEILQNATKGMTREQKLATLETLFGSDAIRAAAVFAEQGAEGYNSMAAAMGKVTAADVAATRLDNLKGSVEQLKGSFETMMITIGEVFLPLVRRVVDAVTSIINVFNGLPPGVQKAIAVLLGVGSATALLTGILIKALFVLTPLLAKFLGFAALKQIFSIFTIGFKALRGGQGVMVALAASTGRAGVVFTRFQKIGKFLFKTLARFPKILAALRFAWAFAFGPWGVAIAAVVAAIVFAYKKFDGFRELVDRIAGAVKNFVTGAWRQLILGIKAFGAAFSGEGITSDSFVGFMERMGVAAMRAWEAIKSLGDLFQKEVMPVLQEAGRVILDELGKAWEELSAVFISTIIPAANDLADTFMKDVYPALKQLWAVLQPILVTFVKIYAAMQIGILIGLFKLAQIIIKYVLPAVIRINTALIVGLIKAIVLVVRYLTFLYTAFIRVADVLIKVVVGAVKLFIRLWRLQWKIAETVIRTTISVIMAVINTFVNTVKSVWSAVWGTIGPVVEAAFKLVVLIIKTWMTLLIVAVTVPLDFLYRGFVNAFNKIKGHVTNVMRFLQPYVAKVLNTIRSHAVSVWNVLKAATLSAWRLIQAYIVNPLTAVYARVRSIVSAIYNYIRGIFNSTRSSTNSIWSGIYNTIVTWIGRVLARIRAIAGNIRQAIGNTRGILVAAGRNIIQGLLDGINAMIGRVQGALNSLTGLIPDWKGPETTDRKLLTRNGALIIQSLITGFRSQFGALRKELGGVTSMIPESVTVRRSVQNAAGEGGPPQWAQDALAGRSIVNNWNVYNPVAEKTSRTTTREATRRANLGMVA